MMSKYAELTCLIIVIQLVTASIIHTTLLECFVLQKEYKSDYFVLLREVSTVAVDL